MCDASKELSDEELTKQIVEGWARVADEYTPRPMTTLERHQVEFAELAEKQAAETPFVLGATPWLKEFMHG